MKYFSEVLTVAAELHNGDLRKDGKTPYIFHPMRVAMAVHECVGDTTYAGNYLESIVYAALLHDTVEDGCTNLNMLQSTLICRLGAGKKEFDYDEIVSIATYTVNLVMALTRIKRADSNYENINKFYYKQVTTAGYPAILVKLYDVRDNLNDMSGLSLHFKKLYINKVEGMLEEFCNYMIVHEDSPLRVEVFNRYNEVKSMTIELSYDL